jgi:hypothetical protein
MPDETRSLKRRDTPENRAFWEFVERTAREGRGLLRRTRPDRTMPDETRALPYERLDSRALTAAIWRRGPDEHVLCLQPFGWHLDGSHIPNAAEHFSREEVCETHRWDVVCDYGPYVALVRTRDAR